MTHDGTTAPGAPRARRVLRAVASVVLYATAALAAWVLWPSTLGGCTTLTIVSGQSMEPTYQSGDLVVSRCGEPQVGDVVVYQPADLGGARIIHRLVGGDGTTGWVVQGDNNDWTDPFAPTNAEVVGVAQLHVPKIGLAGRFVTSPWVWGSCLLLAVALLVWPSARDEDEDEQEGDVPPAASDVAALAATDDLLRTVPDVVPADAHAVPDATPSGVPDGMSDGTASHRRPALTSTPG